MMKSRLTFTALAGLRKVSYAQHVVGQEDQQRLKKLLIQSSYEVLNSLKIEYRLVIEKGIGGFKIKYGFTNLDYPVDVLKPRRR